MLELFGISSMNPDSSSVNVLGKIGGNEGQYLRDKERRTGGELTSSRTILAPIPSGPPTSSFRNVPSSEHFLRRSRPTRTSCSASSYERKVSQPPKKSRREEEGQLCDEEDARRRVRRTNR